MIIHLKHFWKAYAWCILITFLSIMPADGKSPQWFDFKHADKILHVIFYGILTALIIISILQSSISGNIYLRIIILTFILVLAYGSAMEFIQHYLVSTRKGDLLDILFNMAGWAFAAGVLYLRGRMVSGKNRA